MQSKGRKGPRSTVAESKLWRAFTAALQSTATEAQLSGETKQQLKTMIDWSAKHADYVDPLTDLKWTLGQFKNPPWHFGDCPGAGIVGQQEPERLALEHRLVDCGDLVG
jgi:hypothetical protein